MTSRILIYIDEGWNNSIGFKDDSAQNSVLDSLLNTDELWGSGDCGVLLARACV
jgi:hypothetical protein